MTERGGLLPKSQNTALCISGRDILAFGSQSLNMSLCSFVVEYMYIYNLVDIQLSSVPWPTGSSGELDRRFSRDSLSYFFAVCSQDLTDKHMSWPEISVCFQDMTYKRVTDLKWDLNAFSGHDLSVWPEVRSQCVSRTWLINRWPTWGEILVCSQEHDL